MAKRIHSNNHDSYENEMEKKKQVQGVGESAYKKNYLKRWKGNHIKIHKT